MKLRMPFKYYETKRWANFQPHTLQNDCKIAVKLLFCGVCWHFTANKDHDPQQLNIQIVSAYETLYAFQVYETKRRAKFQLHTLQNDCKIAEKLLFCGVCWHFTANKDHDPLQFNNQIISAYKTLPAF